MAEIISSAAVILVAVIEAVAAVERRGLKNARERSERRAEERAQESRLSMQMMDACLELGLATATAVEQGKVSCDLKSAKEKAQQIREEYRNFIRSIAARQVVKI